MSEWHPGIPLEYRNQIVTGDARELAARLPDACADLCLCDPVYENLDDYRWLAREANRVLRPGGALLAYTGIKYQEEVQAILREEGRPVRWLLPVVYAPPNYNRFHPKGICGWALLLWAGGEPKHTFCDVHMNRPEANVSRHPWTKNEQPTAKYLRAFTGVGDVVWDPFTGGGTVPAVCLQNGRDFIAWEQDAEIAAKARQRLRNVTPPLFIADAEPHPALPLEETS